MKANKAASIKRGQSVRLIRSELPTSLAESLSFFNFHNNGKVTKSVGDRVAVRWDGSEALWFSREAVEAVS